MDEQKNENLRNQRLALLIGTMLGQISELLNNIKTVPSLTNEMIYNSLLDIANMAALQVHELFYKGNKPDVVDK